jgi:tetratricopeptide (TPR) repeat protein
VPQGKDKDAVWLDTTIEVAPFGLLIARLRDKQALVMTGDQSIKLVTTPTDAPIPNTQVFKVDGKLGGDGTFEAKIETTSQGDFEVILRSIFRQVPEPNWKELVQQISYGLGYSGTVSDVSASKPEAVSGPFHFAYSYNRKDYPDWKSSQRFTVPGLPFSMPPLRDDSSYPIWLGSPTESESDSKVEIPVGQRPQTPSNVDLKYDFAEYHASYSQENGVLIAKRRLVTKQREIPVAKFEDYKNFVKRVDDDVNQYVLTLIDGASVPLNPSVQGTFPQFLREIQELPESHVPDASRFESEARDNIRKLNVQGALSSVHSALAADPNFARAWVLLGALLLQERQYSESAAAFESAIKIKSDRPFLQASLGSAYLLAGERDKAAAAFATIAAVDSKGETFNDVAYQMTKADLKLPLALDYASKAVRAAEIESQPITLNDLKREDLRKIFKLAATWDTLGWVEERLSNLEQAEQYLKASWKLTQDGVVAGHLCDLYERVQKVGLAVQMCQLALNRMSMSQQLSLADVETEVDHTQRQLAHLVGGTAHPKSGQDASDLIIRDRTFKLPRFLSGTESAEFFVLFGSDGTRKKFKLEGVKFIGGSDKMKLEGKQLTSIDFNFPVPDANPTRFVRRGILGCYQYTGCSFVLLDPASGISLN